MTKKKGRPPLKRHTALQPLSRANHQGLMFCLLLDKGLKNKVEASRMQSFAIHFYESYWQAHRIRLRDILKQMLDASHPARNQFQKEYETLTEHWTQMPATDSAGHIEKLKEHLRSFIRWQERHLFMELQTKYLSQVEKLSIPEAGADVCASWPDPFWDS
ncbi:MAG: hypothetical protein GVX96_04215 [Bacteroidetes bacterium]|jgi:hypothetical protein|nr:hypothetical protein [Bacteroidota bacterium]